MKGLYNLSIAHPKLESIRQWARQEEAIRALIVTGSLARDDGTSDEFSDLDVQIITPDVKRYTIDDSWLDGLGEVWIRFPLCQDLPYRLVWFNGGIKVDFQFLDVDHIRAADLSDEYKRGYHILMDKDDIFRDLPPSPHIFPQPPSPTHAEVQAAINEFWFEAIHVAQFIRRREFWVVKHRDWTMKTNLLRMLEWHARLTQKEPVNTWLLGRRISSWADDETKVAIEGIWGGWDAAELWGAFFVQLKLFRRLSRDVSAALQCDYRADTVRDIEAYIGRLWREDRPNSPKD